MMRWSGSSRELWVATIRMVLQLLAMCYLLVVVFEQDHLWVSVVVVVFMVVVSSLIAVRTIRAQKMRSFVEALFAIAVGGGSVFCLVVFVVLEGGEGFSGRFVIPIAGMIFANAMTAVTLAVERFDAELASGKDALLARKAAWNASLIPQINSFLAVGLVSLPGMMTGQILAGVSPLDAVRYQVLVMAMVLGSSGLAVVVFLARRLAQQSAGEAT